LAHTRTFAKIGRMASPMIDRLSASQSVASVPKEGTFGLRVPPAETRAGTSQRDVSTTGAVSRARLGPDGTKGLILRARGYIFRCGIAQKTFRFLFSRQMRRKPFEVVAISPEPGARTRFCASARWLHRITSLSGRTASS
jgi:hypothetical protein